MNRTLNGNASEARVYAVLLLNAKHYIRILPFAKICLTARNPKV